MKKTTMLLLLWVVPLGLMAGDSGLDSWDNLARLGSGERVEVVDMKLKSFRGTFVSFSPEAISLHVGSDEVAVQRADVLRVTSRERNRRGRHALMGMAIGGGIFTALGVLVTRACSNEGTCGAGTALGIAGFGVGIGAGLGAASPGYPTIYRTKKRP